MYFVLGKTLNTSVVAVAPIGRELGAVAPQDSPFFIGFIDSMFIIIIIIIIINTVFIRRQYVVYVGKSLD